MSGDIFNISDFAKDLLLQMKFGNDANVKSLNIGQSPKQYTVELQKNSARISDINDQFKLHKRSLGRESSRSLVSVDEVLDRLGVVGQPMETSDSLLEQYMPGSCDWILSNEQFISFLSDRSTQASILHINGLPGSGKSVLASFIIQHLEERLELPTKYWYLRYDDHLKRSNRQCLLSLAVQALHSVPGYSNKLRSIGKDVDSIARSDLRRLWNKLFFGILDEIEEAGTHPVYWVIDAVDESESAQAFLGLLGNLRTLRFPLRVIVLARFQTKSQGSFLWLSLVVKELVTCDTDEQLQLVLDETPNLRPADINLCKSILSWVVCSERQLNEVELGEALRPKFSVLSLRHTISRLCGDFVVIDKKGNVSTVHHTAKDFLLKSATSMALAVNPGESHTFIFDKCLATLSDPRFRLRLKSQGCTGFIRYSCLSWQYHMARSDELGHPHGFIRRLGSFLRSTAFLAWIEAIAVAGHLQILPSTAKALKSYVERTKRINADENPLSQPLEDMDLLGVWSTELVRLAGKFGTHLIQNPRSIYTLILGPLAPRVTGLSNYNWDDSLANFSLGNHQRPKAIYCMDSSFAILTSDQVTTYDASTFQETRKYTHNEAVIVLSFNDDGDMLVTGGVETMKVWNVATDQLLYTYSNPNRMRAMALAFSRDSSEILAFRVDSSLRRQLLSEPESWIHIPWKARNEPTHGRGGGAPIAAAFSPDGSKLVMSHRTAPISVWDTDSGNLIGRMERRAGRQFTRSSNLDYAVRLTRNPATEHIVGAWSTGRIFKWYPFDAEHEEMENPSVKASEIACSPDGRLIVVGQMDGSLKILGFDSFTLLYSLSYMTRASAVAVSPDGRRIYDLRQSFCNVWEPNALIRMAEQDDRFSDAASSHYDASVTMSMISEASAPVLEAVTAVCYDPMTTAYAFGNDGGTIKYFSPESCDSFDMQCVTMSITCLVFSQDGRAIASANIDGSVFVRKVSSDWQLEVTPILHIYSQNPVTQLLFDWSGEHLLVKCDELVNIWSLQTKCQISSHPSGAKASCLLPRVAQPGFISIDAEALRYHGVDGSSFARELKIDLDLWAIPDPYHNEKSTEKVSQYANFDELSYGRTIKTPDGSDTLITILKSTRSGARLDTLAAFLTATMLAATPNDTDSLLPLDPAPVSLRPLSRKIQSMIEVPLGFIGGAPQGWSGGIGGTTSRPSAELAFIDRDFWVRTWSVDDIEGMYSKQQFFLSRDWVRLDSLKLASVTPDGRLLCPRAGEVAVVHNGFAAEWIA
ncbi:hypothetical protein LA080_010575 [Diaporthe eres]|nr:hypothetical protein LA080_010575 [Diaporthe eres]